MKVEFKRPEVKIITLDPNEKKICKGDIEIDFSILKRYTDENMANPNRVFVRTDYYDGYNYFKTSTADLVTYKIKERSRDDRRALETILKNIFGFSVYRDGQYGALVNTLNGNDTIGLLPTGGGKSLIYQIAGLLQPCLTFIVAPIKALMKDQRDNLDAKWITNTHYILSDQEGSEKGKILEEFANAKYQFVWISPERFQKEDFRDQLKRINEKYILGNAVVDEVHCLSEWGHQFRTSYLNLAKTIRRYCPRARIIGLTATASDNVLKDIEAEFNIARKNIRTMASFSRKELNFFVEIDDGYYNYAKEELLSRRIKKLAEEANVLELNGDNTKCGIIFTRTVNGPDGCYQVASNLQGQVRDKSKIAWYAGKSPEIYVNGLKHKVFEAEDDLNKYKDSIQKDFMENEFPVLVATKAFGMGIDKPNIRYTIHYGIPESIEALYQEAGRAGRGEIKKAEGKDIQRYDALNYILLSKEYFLEKYDKDGFEKILSNPNMTVEEINRIMEEFYSVPCKMDQCKDNFCGKKPHEKRRCYMARDMLNNINLWRNSAEDISIESSRILKFSREIVKSGGIAVVRGETLGVSKQTLEKIVYKLSLIGVVDDWIIESWDAVRPIIRVKFKEFTRKTIVAALNEYIHKYDKSYNIDKRLDNYFSETDSRVEKIIETPINELLRWQYETIIYNRREAIGNVYRQCINFVNNPDGLRDYMEGYFRFGKDVAVYDYIADYPDDYNRWMEIFLDKNGELLSGEELKSRRATLQRYLETYRDNTGLNIISGLYSIILDSFTDNSARIRMEMALKNIEGLTRDDKVAIMDELKKITKYMSKEQLLLLSKILSDNLSDILAEIHAVIGDDYSLNKYLKDINIRICRCIGELVNGHK